MDALTVEFDYDSLGDKADIVRGLAKRIHARVKRAVEDVIEIGTCLAETKRFLGRGRWGEWLKAEFRWSDETASNYMNVAARYSQIPNYLEFAPTVLYELCRPGTPVAAIEQASEMVSSGVPITVAAVKEIIEQHRDEDEGGEADEVDGVCGHDAPIGEFVAKRIAREECAVDVLEAAERLDQAISRVAKIWPSDAAHALADKLESVASDIRKTGSVFGFMEESHDR